MLEDFRSRMGEVRQEMDRLAGQAEDLERVAQEQQVRLEEMDLLVRQRDEQLAEQQARVEELEETLRQRDQELDELRTLAAERQEALARQEQEWEDLRTQLSQREAAEVALREQLAERAEAPEAPSPDVLEQLVGLASMVSKQGKTLSKLHSLVQEELARLHSRLDSLEIPATAPAATAVAAPPVEVTAPSEVVEAPEEPPAPVSVPVLPIEMAVAVEDPLQAILYEALETLPAAALIGMASLDGLSVELVARQEVSSAQPLEIELADLAADASRIASTLNSGPLLTMAFQIGMEHYLVSLVGEDHFAFLLTPADSMDDFRRAQATLLQAASRLSDCY